MDNAVKIVESLNSQFPELDSIEEAGTVGTFMRGAAQNIGQQLKTAAVNTAKKVVPQGIQQAVKAGQQAVQQKAATAPIPTQPQNLEQQFQKAGQAADLEAQFAQVGQANSASPSDLMNDLTEPIEVFTAALQALQTFANQPEPTQPTQQATPTTPAQPDVNMQQRTAEGIFKHPEYKRLQSLYEADASDQTVEFKQAVTKFLGKYSDPAALAKDQKGQQILQKLVQVAGNLGINIPDMPSVDQLKNVTGATQQNSSPQAVAGAPTAVNSPDDLKKALDANPQAAQAFVQALARAPKNGPIGQAFNNLLQKPVQ